MALRKPEPEEENLLNQTSEQQSLARLDALLASMAEKNSSHAKAMMVALLNFLEAFMAQVEDTHIVDPRTMLMMAREMAVQLHSRVRPDEHSPSCNHDHDQKES